MPESKVPFKFTFPIVKSYEDGEGRLFIKGEASGPEIDAQMERMSPELVEDFAHQIKSAVAKGDPLPYRDAHAKDGVLMDLGHLVDGSINDEQHLDVVVELDRDNPAAVYLWKQINRGKKFGMSIGGYIHDWVDEFVEAAGTVVRTFRSVSLFEISNTTSPAWTPSFGTVLQRAVEKSLSDGTKEESNLDPENEPVEAAAEQPAPEAAEAAPEGTEAPVAAAAEESAEKSDEERLAEIAAKAVRDALTEAGLLKAEKPEAEKPTEKSDEAQSGASETEPSEPGADGADTEKSALARRVKELEADLAEKSRRLEALENEPSSERPNLVTKSEQDEALSTLKAMTPSERMRLALAVMHGENF